MTYHYVWKNGTTTVGSDSATLDLSQPGNGARGDVISVSVTASAGTVTRPDLASPIVIVVSHVWRPGAEAVIRCVPGSTGTHPSIHGHQGAPPKGVEMSRFKIMIPKRSDERKENIEPGKGDPKTRKG